MTDEIEDKKAEGETGENQDAKLFTQADLNKFLSKEKKAFQAKYDALNTDFTTLQADVTKKAEAEEAKQAIVVESLKKDLPANILKLLEKLSVAEQLEYLQDAENVIPVDKKKIPSTPQANGDETPKQKSLGTRF